MFLENPWEEARNLVLKIEMTWQDSQKKNKREQRTKKGKCKMPTNK